ncbi:MAG TPA: sigma-54 dependent transcriptional regulator [Candidatus Angelobacter sp.]|jgi:DNA-binding NtrC family response regulator|nr:sigma-54 dependent transcriptional regulator [Candidatus Angelobacter sp.]
MPKALVIENVSRDVERLIRILTQEAIEVVVCQSGSEVEHLLSHPDQSFAIAFHSLEIPGPPSGMELIVQCRKQRPQMPIVVMSGALDLTLAARASAFGARDFIQKPLDQGRVRSCLHELLQATDPLVPMLQKLRETSLGENGEKLVGESTAFLDTLRQVAKVIQHSDSRVLILGESGTGKELVARAIHCLGPLASRPWIAVNIGETPATLVEASLFGHERGAFTDARELRRGLFELAANGTLFLDEIGNLELPLQGKLLRVIQERQFRRLGGSSSLHFNARLICATNSDLALAVQEGMFRRDLYHRIAEVVINVPPLRERHGDVDVLLKHFLQAYRPENHVKLARETQTILRSYSFPGNIRELQNLVKGALIQSDGNEVLPGHLPLQTMGKFLGGITESGKIDSESGSVSAYLAGLVAALQGSLPENWLQLPYRHAAQAVEKAFDRVYLQHKLEKAHHNITRAASTAELDTKTFRKHWENSGLPPLKDDKQET